MKTLSMRRARLILVGFVASAALLSAASLEAQSAALPNIVSGTPSAPTPAPRTQTAPAQPSAPATVAPATGAAEQVVTSTAVPTSMPLVFTDEAGLLEQGRTVSRTQRVQGKLGQVIGTAEEAERLRQVVLKGSLQAEDLANDETGATRRIKVSWTSVSRPDTNRAAILPAPLQSQFKTNGNVVPEGQQVTAVGDYSQVLSAVNSLYGDGPAPSAENAAGAAAAEAETTVSNELETPTNAARGVEGGGAGSVSGGAGFATPKTDFTLPEVIETTSSEALPPVITESSENCPARVDLPNNEVVFQSQTLEDGVPVSSCQDTLDRFTLQASYVGCTDQVDQAARTAYPTFRRFYVNKGGGTEYVDAECIPDNQQAYDLVEDESACTISADLAAMQATVRSQLTYADRTNRKVVVADCRAKPDTATIPITNTEIGCALRDDFAGGFTYVQARAVYTRPDNVEAVAQACTDTGERLPHVRITNVCNVLTDFAGYLAIPQYRVQVNKDGVASYRSDCTPDTANQVSLQKDATQCTGQFVHGAAGTQSYGTARWWHDLDADNVKNYVTTCEQDTDVVYAHSERVTAYQHDDTTKTSRPMTEIYITAPGVGEVTVSASQVRAGAAEIAYVLDREETRADGAATYDGCNKFQEQSVYSVYRRTEVAGHTEFSEFKEAGPAIGPVDACEQQILGSWPLQSQSAMSRTTSGCGVEEDCTEGCTYFYRERNVRTCTYAGSRRFLREDQEMVGTNQATRSTSVAGACNSSNSPAVPPVSCSGPVTDQPTINSWATQFGWFVEGYY